jgi:Protein of unknown function (DUF1360)
MAVRTHTQAPDNSRLRVEQERPLGGYAALTSLFGALSVGFAEWLRRSGRALPERIAPADLALMTVATHKLSRLIAKDRVTSVVRAPFTAYEGEAGPGEVQEAAQGSGLVRAVGELVICPYCLDMWVAAAFTAGFVVAPRGTRWVTSTLTALSGADALQLGYKKLEQSV